MIKELDIVCDFGALEGNYCNGPKAWQEFFRLIFSFEHFPMNSPLFELAPAAIP